MIRAITSVGPPAANGTTIRTGWVGQASARARLEAMPDINKDAQAAELKRRRVIITVFLQRCYRAKILRAVDKQNAVRPDTLIPSPQPSTKPGQVQYRENWERSLSTVETLLAARRADVMASFPTLTRHKAISELIAMGWLAPPRCRTAEPLMLLDRFVRLHDGPEEYGVSGRAD
jgi:hypothetical protein